MPDTKISADPVVTSPADADSFPVVSGGANGRMTWGGLKVAMQAAIGSGGGSGVSQHPGYISGRIYRPGPYAPSSAAQNANTLYVYPLVIEQAVTVSAFAAQVTTIAASTNVKFAIYNNDPSTSRPGTKLADLTSVVDGGTLGVQVLSIASNLVLAAGVYWVAAVGNGTPTLATVGSTDLQIARMIGFDPTATTLGSTNLMLSVSGFGYATAFPASLGGTTYVVTGSGPLLAFKVA